MNSIYNFQGSVCSDLALVKDFLKKTIFNLEKFIMDEEIIYDIRLIINELVVNGALHGNELNEEKKVFLKIDLDRDSIKILVRDEGSGIDYDSSSYDCNSLKCSGRGLFIVEALTDNLVLKGNEVIAIKNIL